MILLTYSLIAEVEDQDDPENQEDSRKAPRSSEDVLGYIPESNAASDHYISSPYATTENYTIQPPAQYATQPDASYNYDYLASSMGQVTLQDSPLTYDEMRDRGTDGKLNPR